MHVLMPVDEIRRPAERVDEGLELRAISRRERRHVEALQQRQPQASSSSGRNAPSASGA